MHIARRLSGWLVGVGFALAAGLASNLAAADDYNYNVNFEGLSGNIIASCDACPLNAHDVVAWAFSGNGYAFNSTMSDAQLLVIGTELQATPTAVTYAFTPTNWPDSAVFLANNQSLNLLTYPTDASTAGMDLGEVDVCSGSIVYSASAGCYGQLATGTAEIAHIASVVHATPELDPSAFAASLTLLLGALAILRARMARSRA